MLLTFETLKTVIGTEPDEEGFKTITEERETVLEAEFADLSDGGLIVVRNYVPGNWREILYEEARQYLRLGSHRPSCALS
jgi:hypothetical protein